MMIISRLSKFGGNNEILQHRKVEANICFSEVAQAEHEVFFDETSRKLVLVQSESKHHLISNQSKTRDLV